MHTSDATASLEGRYAALHAGVAELSTNELLDVIGLAQREKDAASARQAVALAHLAGRESRLDEDGTWVEVHHGLGHQRLDAPELAAPRIGCSVHVASSRVRTAVQQLTRTPAVVDARPPANWTSTAQPPSSRRQSSCATRPQPPSWTMSTSTGQG